MTSILYLRSCQFLFFFHEEDDISIFYVVIVRRNLFHIHCTALYRTTPIIITLLLTHQPSNTTKRTKKTNAQNKHRLVLFGLYHPIRTNYWTFLPSPPNNIVTHHTAHRTWMSIGRERPVTIHSEQESTQKRV